jgi:hypothetical protein
MELTVVAESSDYALIALAGRLDLTGVNEIDNEFSIATKGNRCAIVTSLESATGLIGSAASQQAPEPREAKFTAQIQNSVFEFERLNPLIANFLDIHRVQPSVAYAVHLAIEENERNRVTIHVSPQSS